MKIAVIGAGIAGLGAAWMISRAGCHVSVYEAADKPGGHADTFFDPRGVLPPVDTGFIVFNDRTYPDLMGLFDHLGVEYTPTDMSFGVSLDNGKLEYGSGGFSRIFAQKRNLLRPEFYKMLREILRFYREAPQFLKQNSPEMTLGAYLMQKGYSDIFIRQHILPMGAAIWSTGSQAMMNFPARAFIRFFERHGLLSLNNHPQWYTVKGGSWNYVSRITAIYNDRIRLMTSVTAVSRQDNGVVVHDAGGESAEFDAAILACHSDQALAILKDPGPAETRALGAIPYAQNRAVLHQDPSLMPRSRKAWSSWNYLATTEDGQVCVSYDMNKLQNLKTDKPLIVTLNPTREPDLETVLKETHYAHPQFGAEAFEAQEHLSRIQGTGKVWFAGAWCGYGFHEDGLRSGLDAAEAITGMRAPWRSQ